MRGISIWCEVVCDKCYTTTTGAYYRNPSTIAYLRKKAMECGWRVISNNTYCPKCIKSMEKSTKENKQ